MVITNLTWEEVRELLMYHREDAEVLEQRIQKDGVKKHAVEIFYSLLDAENLLGIVRGKFREEYEKLMEKTGQATGFTQSASLEHSVAEHQAETILQTISSQLSGEDGV